MKGDKNLWVLVFVCIINSLGFGIIVPILYSYGKTFGVTGETLGILTASFSIAQFFATPVLGSLSDKWGRKPLLVISLAGTCISFILFAEARSMIMLFAARILDGLTGGNVSVAQAMVSDTARPDNRARRFGILSSAFGFGFVIGPAIGGFLNSYGMQVPFYFAAGISLIGTLCSLFFLKETNPPDKSKKDSEKTKFSFVALITTLKRPVIGTAVFTGFMLTMAQFTMIIAFQTFTVDVLKINPTQIGILYAGFGVSGIIMQLCVPLFTKWYSSKSTILTLSTSLCFVAMFVTGLTNHFIAFVIGICIYGLFNGLRNPMLNAIIADHIDHQEQGKILGINQSYASIGQTLGPVTAGFAALLSVHAIFFLSSCYILAALLLSIRLKKKE
ncbi:MFS transporter [Mucilaginibacter rubeus]|uniref:MFS transporter n=1 Tax=Mucilaginibacter rubeus TaxID=2027860 RepID=A0AAE6JAU8_9SPHI|nr:MULTISPECIES: MFS transporter [Mucilaginibacter]QEM02131.1 MFS transporter [Mucilaginibacter rubeus]QEM14759.1 MFS transporter [Mucilaginibacter gossypii]QTE42533.1 MFS transporter [Mucilaginibacter rubeus]QTE49136.1 MFS transporter [Mucilaginibacter rubeus]QTE54234.1 MFS transporter [Mucilaginibacter rubeus]